MGNIGATKGKSNKEKAYELFDQGASDQMIGVILNLSENTIKTYHSHYRKSRSIGFSKTTKDKNIDGKLGTTNVNITRNTAERKDLGIVSMSEEFLKEEICMALGTKGYTIEYYIDLKDGSIWFDFLQMISALKKENIIPPMDYKLNVSDRYFRDEKIFDRMINLIDRNALFEVAQNIGDYTFMTAVFNLYKFNNKDVFFEFRKILHALEMIEEFISNDHIDKKIDEVKAYNTGQLDFLHGEIDNDPYATEEQSLDKFKKLKNLRLARRSIKNELVLSQCLRNSLRYYKLHCGHIHNIRQRIGSLMDDLYTKKYNPRLDGLDDWQKELVESIIETDMTLVEAE